VNQTYLDLEVRGGAFATKTMLAHFVDLRGPTERVSLGAALVSVFYQLIDAHIGRA